MNIEMHIKEDTHQRHGFELTIENDESRIVGHVCSLAEAWGWFEQWARDLTQEAARTAGQQMIPGMGDK